MPRSLGLLEETVLLRLSESLPRDFEALGRSLAVAVGSLRKLLVLPLKLLDLGLEFADFLLDGFLDLRAKVFEMLGPLLVLGLEGLHDVENFLDLLLQDVGAVVLGNAARRQLPEERGVAGRLRLLLHEAVDGVLLRRDQRLVALRVGFLGLLAKRLDLAGEGLGLGVLLRESLLERLVIFRGDALAVRADGGANGFETPLGVRPLGVGGHVALDLFFDLRAEIAKLLQKLALELALDALLLLGPHILAHPINVLLDDRVELLSERRIRGDEGVQRFLLVGHFHPPQIWHIL